MPFERGQFRRLSLGHLNRVEVAGAITRLIARKAGRRALLSERSAKTTCLFFSSIRADTPTTKKVPTTKAPAMTWK